MVLFEDTVHKALASKVRRDILLSLGRKSRNLTGVAEDVGRKPQTVDFHLKLLEKIGIVEGRTEKGRRLYALRNRDVLAYLRERKPVPASARPKPPEEIVEEALKGVLTRLDRIEKKLDAIKLTRR